MNLSEMSFSEFKCELYAMDVDCDRWDILIEDMYFDGMTTDDVVDAISVGQTDVVEW